MDGRLLAALLCISVAAAGREGDRTLSRYVPYSVIGKTIDKRRDVVGLSLLKPDFDEESGFATEYMRTSESRYKFVETNTDANNLLNVDGEVSLQLELGVGQNSASGTGGYLNSVENRDEFAELLFTTKLTMYTKSLKNLEESIDGEKCRSIPDRLKGTHVITGIEYGASCIISVRIRTKSDEEKETIKGKIEGKIGVSKVDVDVSGELDKLKSQLKKMSNVTVYTFCNARLDSFPTNAEEGIELAKTFPTLITDQIPDGVPIRMELTPISDIPACDFSVEWQRGSLLNQYMENAVSMVQDLKSAYKKLWNCMEVLSPGTDDKSVAIKASARELRERMKSVDYRLKTFINDIDQTGNVTQFEEVKNIYSEGHATDEQMYGNRYWKNLVSDMCQQLKALPTEKESSEMLRHKSCDPSLNLIDNGKQRQWASGDVAGAGLAVDGNPVSCFKVEPEKGETAVWAASLVSYSRNLTTVEISFGEVDAEHGDINVFISNDLTALKKEERPEDMYNVGKIPISELHKDLGLKFHVRGIRAPIEGDSGYVAVLRFEATTKMTLCEVKVEGRHCPTLV